MAGALSGQNGVACWLDAHRMLDPVQWAVEQPAASQPPGAAAVTTGTVQQGDNREGEAVQHGGRGGEW